MKHQIELYSGLLEASQHAAASFGDPKKADEYVQQTFTQIRDRLLQVQLPHDQPLASASEESADANHLIGLLSKIADLGSKKLGWYAGWNECLSENYFQTGIMPF